LTREHAAEIKKHKDEVLAKDKREADEHVSYLAKDMVGFVMTKQENKDLISDLD